MTTTTTVGKQEVSSGYFCGICGSLAKPFYKKETDLEPILIICEANSNHSKSMTTSSDDSWVDWETIL